MLNLTDLIGIPYKDNGRDSTGMDCYGLAIEVEKRLGKNLRDVVYDNHDYSLTDKYAPTLNVKRKENDILNTGDLLEIRLRGELHIGIVLDNKRFIHATRNQGVRISLIANYPINSVYEVISDGINQSI